MRQDRRCHARLHAAFAARQIARTGRGRDRVLPCERRIADDRVEPGIFARKNLGKFDLPMKRPPAAVRRGRRRPRRRSKSQFGVIEPVIQLLDLLPLVSRAPSACRRKRTPQSPRRRRCAPARSHPERASSARPALRSARRRRRCGSPRGLQARGRRLLDHVAETAAGPASMASQCAARNLCARQPDEAVAGFQRVIEESELMVARQRRKPQRQPREIDRHRVAVDAIEAFLRDEAARVQRLVLVGRNAWAFPRRTCSRPAPAARRAGGRPRRERRRSRRRDRAPSATAPPRARPCRPGARRPAPAHGARSARSASAACSASRSGGAPRSAADRARRARLARPWARRARRPASRRLR